MKNKKIITIISVCMAAVLIVGGLGYLSKGFRDWKVKEWFKDKDTPSVTSGGNVLDNNGNILDDGQPHNLPQGMMFLTAGGDVETGVTLTATLTPANATYRLVDWSLSWFFPNSSFAAGKSVLDYITITPVEDGSLTAIVSCSQAFGERILIKVSSRSNPLVLAECSADYRQRIVDFTGGLRRSGQTDPDFFLGDSFVFSTDNFSLPYGSYYLSNDDLIYSSVYTMPVGEFNIFGHCSWDMFVLPDFKAFCSGLDINLPDYSLDDIRLLGVNYTTGAIANFFGSSNFNDPLIYSQLIDIFDTYSGDVFQFNLRVGDEYSSFSKTWTFGVDTSRMIIPVTGVSLDIETITF